MAHPESREGSRGKEEHSRPSWRAGSGQKALLESRKGLGEMGGVGSLPGGSGSIGKPIRRAVRGWRTSRVSGGVGRPL